jgi:hypothetical protein
MKPYTSEVDVEITVDARRLLRLGQPETFTHLVVRRAANKAFITKKPLIASMSPSTTTGDGPRRDDHHIADF